MKKIDPVALELLLKLRWIIVCDDIPIMACLSRRRAETLAQMGRQGTPNRVIKIVDAWTGTAPAGKEKA